MDEVRLYKECNVVLNRLLTNADTLFRDELEKLSPDYAEYIIQEFAENNIAKWDSLLGCFCDINKDSAIPIYYKRHYERLYDFALANRKRDELSERNTVSVEESTKWAKQSAEASLRSAESAEKANIIAEKSDIRSKYANCIAIVSIVVSLLGLLISFFYELGAFR